MISKWLDFLRAIIKLTPFSHEVGHPRMPNHFVEGCNLLTCFHKVQTFPDTGPVSFWRMSTTFDSVTMKIQKSLAHLSLQSGLYSIHMEIFLAMTARSVRGQVRSVRRKLTRFLVRGWPSGYIT